MEYSSSTRVPSPKCSNDGGNLDLSTAAIAARLDRILEEPPLATPGEEGDVEAAFAESTGTVVEARYDVPYLAHAALEPLNCTVRVDADGAGVWVGHQSSSAAQNAVAAVTGLPGVDLHPAQGRQTFYHSSG